MTPTETLRAEHRIILRMLGCLEILMKRIRREKAVETADLREIARFFEQYTDEFHHAKEQEVLFPALVAQGIPDDRGPIAVMLRDHEDGGEPLRGMREAVEASEPSPEQLLAFATHAAHFVPLLRDHIGKEDHVLFRMAEDALPPRVVVELEDAFETFLDQEFGRDRHRELEALVTRFGEKYGIGEQSNADNLPASAQY